jgi:hypothetical protein
MRLLLHVVACIGCAAVPHVFVTGAGDGVRDDMAPFASLFRFLSVNGITQEENMGKLTDLINLTNVGSPANISLYRP